MNNLFKKIEYKLYNLKILDTKIENIDIDINRILNDVRVAGVSYEQKSSPTNAFNSSVENEVIKREERETEGIIAHLRAKKDYLVAEKRIIENALKHLSDIELKLVELRYFSRNKMTWLQISLKMGYDESYCKKLRNKIITKLINILE